MSQPLIAAPAASLAAQVSSALKDAIFAGRLKPGEALRELHLARSLNVSQSTVREALAQLERVGLVARERNRRTTVTSFTEAEVRERLELRLALEEMAAVKAAAHCKRADLAALALLANRIEQAGRRSRHAEHVEADMQFHRLLWQLSASPLLAATLDQLTTPLFAFLSLQNSAQLKDLRQSKPHAKLVTALRSRDDQRIRREIRAHILGSYARFFSGPAASRKPR